MEPTGEMEAYAIENIECERKRIHIILSRLINDEKVVITQDILDRVILGNRK